MCSFYTSDVSFTYKSHSYTLSNLPTAEKKSSNLIKLFERKKGTLFRVDKEGELVEVKGLKGWISYQWHKKEEKAKVKEAIDSALIYLNDFLSEYDQEVAEAAIKYLFDKKGNLGIGKLGKALYNHKLLKCDNILSKYLLPPQTVRLKLSDHQFVDITNKKFAEKQLPFPLTIDLGDGKLNHNLRMLLKRKKGQVYQVNDEGKLEKVKKSWFHITDLTERNQKVQTVVSSVIENLNAHLSEIKMTKTHQLVLEHIFSSNGSLCRMNRHVFNRGAIAEGSFLEKQFAPLLEVKREALDQSLQNLRDQKTEEAKLKVEQAFMDLVFEEFKFAQKLGMDLERVSGSGSGGARFARDRYGKKILVVKPGDEGPSGVNNPQWYARFKRVLISGKPCLEGNSEPMAEYDSWLWDRRFKIWSVPPTDVRYVVSRDFVGSPYKECSIQMFVEGCDTLGEYVGISPKIQWLPRRFLRWYCGKRKVELLEKLPQHSLERIAVHNMGIEDTDCHFENILVKTSEISTKKTILDSIQWTFPDGSSESDASHRDDKPVTVTDTEIQTFVSKFFKSAGNQDLLDHLLFSETITIKEKTKKITLIKHDGGSSNPKAHPRSWDILSLRFKHLFEVLPHFEKGFSKETKNLINKKETIFASLLFEKGKSNVRNILTKEVFEAFWGKEEKPNLENQNLIKNWIYETNADKEYDLRLELIRKLFQATNEKAQQGPYFQFYFNHHLKRIRGSLQTRIDSFRVLKAYVNSEEHVIRDMFKNVKSAKDFEKELKGLDSFEDTLNRWQKRDITQIVSTEVLKHTYEF